MYSVTVADSLNVNSTAGVAELPGDGVVTLVDVKVGAMESWTYAYGVGVQTELLPARSIAFA